MKPIATFRLGLNVCPTANAWGRTASSAGWARARVKTACWESMIAQYAKQFSTLPPRIADEGAWKAMLRGRRVVCTRHSSSQPDRYSGWSKIPVDLLQVPRANRTRGLCLIYDDSPAYSIIEEHWELAKRSEGYATIEVYEAIPQGAT